MQPHQIITDRDIEIWQASARYYRDALRKRPDCKTAVTHIQRHITENQLLIEHGNKHALRSKVNMPYAGRDKFRTGILQIIGLVLFFEACFIFDLIAIDAILRHVDNTTPTQERIYDPTYKAE